MGVLEFLPYALTAGSRGIKGEAVLNSEHAYGIRKDCVYYG